MMVEGKLQVEGEVIHVIVDHWYDLSSMLRKLSVGKTEKAFSDGRNFH
jgi:error-prone DNA polymerase